MGGSFYFNVFFQWQVVELVCHCRLTDGTPTAFLKLADFGIAFEVMSRRMAGTPNYLPWEVWNEGAPADKYVDSYACVLYEMAEGKLLVEDETLSPRPPPVFHKMDKWNHGGGFLKEVFAQMMEKPEQMNSNWFGWRAIKAAVKSLLIIDYATGMMTTSKDDQVLQLSCYVFPCFFPLFKI